MRIVVYDQINQLILMEGHHRRMGMKIGEMQDQPRTIVGLHFYTRVLLLAIMLVGRLFQQQTRLKDLQ